jgi:pimeloyl-ACP methyl ester carboxylesterase
MNSPIAALTWEIWRKGRRSACLSLGCVIACALINLAHISESARDVFSNLFGVLMVLSFLLLMGIFNYTESNPTKEWSGFPYRLFSLPVRTWRLVALPMLMGLVAVELLYIAWIKLVWTNQNIMMPEWFAVVLGAYMIFYQTTLWSLAGLRITRVAVLTLGGVSSIAVACLPFFARIGSSPWFGENRLLKLVAGAAGLAAVFAWAVVSRQRCSGRRRNNRILVVVNKIVDAMPRRTTDFASPAAAQFWFEWRRAGFLLPVGTALFLGVVGRVSWMFRADADFTLRALELTLALPLALSLAMGRGFMKPEFWSVSVALPSFLAVRPMTAGDFVISKMKVAALSVVISWLLVIGFIAMWLPGWANTRQLEMLLYTFHQQYPHSWVLIIALSLCALPVLGWRFMVSGFWAGLCGRRFYLMLSTIVLAGMPLLALLACAIWSDAIDAEIKFHPDKAKLIVPHVIGWVLAVAVVAKLWLAVFSWRNISSRRACQYLLLWVGATVCFVVLAIVARPPFDTYRWEHLFVLAALLLFPLGRLGLAPAALANNRHGSARLFQRNGPVKRICILLAMATTGAAVALAIDPGRFAFQYVDAGGHPVRMLFLGQGKPTVVFENGRRGSEGAPLETWNKVQAEVSKFTSTISYDQSGTGLSALGPRPHDGEQNARELHTALQNAGAVPPYILVGHSFGGPFIRVFAGLYPGEVAGLVLVDPTQEEFINRDGGRQSADIPDDDWREIQAGLAQAHESRVPPGIPVVLITGMGPRVLPGFITEKEKREYKTMHQLWLKFHSQWIETIPNSQHIITENSGHGIPFEEPELVINAVRKMVEQIRAHQISAPAR